MRIVTYLSLNSANRKTLIFIYSLLHRPVLFFYANIQILGVFIPHRIQISRKEEIIVTRTSSGK